MNPPPIKYRRPKLYPKQREFVDCKARYTIVEASTKTGKTVGCLLWLFELAMSGKPGQNFWWVAPTYSVAGIAFNRLKRWLSDSELKNRGWTPREAEQAIVIGGRKIWFKGADKPDSLYAEDVYGVVIDEACRCKEEAWHAVRSTITATRGPAKIIGNVRGKKNWAYNLARKAQGGEEGMAYFKLTAYDAADGGVLDLAEIEDAKRTLPAHIFKELYLAEASDDGGNPFGLNAIRDCLIKTIPASDPVAFGIDLAKSTDWTVVVGLDAEGRACVLERWQSDWGQTRRKILDLVGSCPALVDSTGVGDPIVEDLIRERPAVEGFKFTASSKQQLMEGLAAAVQRNEIRIPEGWLQSEMEAFEYEYTRGGVKYSAPSGLHDDGVCALALAVRITKNFNPVDARVMSTGEPGVLSNRGWTNFDF